MTIPKDLATPYSAAPTNAGADTQVLVTTDLAQRVVDAMSWPITIQYPDRITESEANQSLGELQVLKVADAGHDTRVPDFDDTFDKELRQVATDVSSGKIPAGTFPDDEQKAFETIGQWMRDGEHPDDANARDAFRLLLGKPKVTVDILWMKFEAERPKVTLGNPIVLSDMTVHAQAKIKACIKWGGSICVKVTTPRVRIDARKVMLDLSSVGPIAYGTPKAGDIDIVIRIKLGSWKYDITIGITKVVNEQLKKQGPVKLIDLSTMEQSIPYSSKKLKITSMGFTGDPRGLLLTASMSIV